MFKSLGSRWQRPNDLACTTVGRHSDSSTLDPTMLRCVTVAPPALSFWHTCLARTFWSLRVTLYDLSLLAFVFIVGLRHYWLYHLGKFWNVFFYRLHWCGKCFVVLDCTQSLASITCFSQQGQDVRMNNFFRVNACLCCSSVSSIVQNIYAWHVICLRHTLRLSDCLTSFTSLIWTLPLLLMLRASTLSAILYFAAAAGNLMSASSSSSTHQFSDLNFLTSDVWLVVLFFQVLRVHLLVLTIHLVLWCVLLSFLVSAEINSCLRLTCTTSL